MSTEIPIHDIKELNKKQTQNVISYMNLSINKHISRSLDELESHRYIDNQKGLYDAIEKYRLILQELQMFHTTVENILRKYDE